jgi:hypothetical protein
MLLHLNLGLLKDNLLTVQNKQIRIIGVYALLIEKRPLINGLSSTSKVLPQYFA